MSSPVFTALGPGHQISTWILWASWMLLLNIMFILVWWNAQCKTTNTTNIDWIVTAVSRQPLHHHHILKVALELVNSGKTCWLLTELIIHKYNLCSPRHLKVFVMIVTVDMNMYERTKSTYSRYSIWVNIRLVSYVQNITMWTNSFIVNLAALKCGRLCEHRESERGKQK